MLSLVSGFVLVAAFRLATSSSHVYFPDVVAGPISQKFKFGYDVEIENLAFRQNGNILFTTPSPAAEVWQINPTAVNGSAQLIAHFKNSSALGISEVEHDVFAVSTGHLNPGLDGVVGTFAIYLLNFANGPEVNITKLVDVAEAKFLNKLTTLYLNSKTILAGDSERGLVYAINTVTGITSVVLEDKATMQANSNGFPVGINGIKRVGKFLYYVNSSKALFCRVALHFNGTAAGPYEIIANIKDTLLLPDDFTVLSDGQAFIAGSNQILYIQSDGTYFVLKGGVNDTELAGATSAQFGLGKYSSTLFVTTSGHISAPANITFIEPGKIVALKIYGL